MKVGPGVVVDHELVVPEGVGEEVVVEEDLGEREEEKEREENNRDRLHLFRKRPWKEREEREEREAKNGDRRQEPVSPYFRSRLLVSEASPRYSFSALTNNAQPTTALTTPC